MKHSVYYCLLGLHQFVMLFFTSSSWAWLETEPLWVWAYVIILLCARESVCVWVWACVIIQLCERESVCDCERVWWYSCVSVRVCVIVSVCDDTVVWAWECVWVWACVIQLWAWECVWLWTCEIQLCERESVCECERVSVNCKNSVCTNVTVILCGYVGVCAWVWQREHVCVCVWASLNPRNVRRLQSNTQYSQFRKAVQILSVKSVR